MKFVLHGDFSKNHFHFFLERTRPPESTQEMINLGEYMLNVKNKFMNTLKEEIECSKGHLLYLIDVHIFSKEDINLNTTTLAWPQKIKPVFEQNTELVEDCKARSTFNPFLFIRNKRLFISSEGFSTLDKHALICYQRAMLLIQ